MKNEARQQSRCRILRFRTSPEGKDTQPLYAGFKSRLLQGAITDIKWTGNLLILVLAIVT